MLLEGVKATPPNLSSDVIRAAEVFPGVGTAVVLHAAQFGGEHVNTHAGPAGLLKPLQEAHRLPRPPHGSCEKIEKRAQSPDLAIRGQEASPVSLVWLLDQGFCFCFHGVPAPNVSSDFHRILGKSILKLKSHLFRRAHYSLLVVDSSVPSRVVVGSVKEKPQCCFRQEMVIGRLRLWSFRIRIQ